MALFFAPVSLLPIERYATFLGAERMKQVALRIAELRDRLAGRAIWNVSSSYVGGGVAEMVRSLLAYARGADVDARWVIVRGPQEFFRVTKRVHNAIHGSEGDGSPLGEAERLFYEHICREWAAELAPMVRPSDVVIIHDPQPAAMISAMSARGAHVIWRCHIGRDEPNSQSLYGWNFLSPFLRDASAYVFSRAPYIPSSLDATRATIIPPSIDPFSAKNQPLSEDVTRAILCHAGIIAAPGGEASPAFLREDGTPGRVDRYADVLSSGALPGWDTPVVVQVSRWDRLKDPVGVLLGFSASQGLTTRRAHLLLAGPSTRTVADDPEDGITYQSVVDAWRNLPEESRSRAHLISLPTVDVDENAAIVNALQRHATVIVQKSLSEGFGLTVTEAMWKARPILASGVGGIRDQIENGVHGMLLGDPTDLGAFAEALEHMLANPALGREMGEKARERALEQYLGIDALLHYGALIEALDRKTAVLKKGA